jgi:hypothetical protein
MHNNFNSANIIVFLDMYHDKLSTIKSNICISYTNHSKNPSITLMAYDNVPNLTRKLE